MYHLKLAIFMGKDCIYVGVYAYRYNLLLMLFCLGNVIYLAYLPMHVFPYYIAF